MMAANVLDILIQATDNASVVLESIQNRLGDLGSQGPSAFSRVDAAASSVHSRLTGIYGAVTALVAGLTAGRFVQVPARFESLTKQLETVTKSGDKARDAMSWVTDFAARTPSEIDKVAGAYARLASYGFDPKEILTPIGNAASGMQKELDQAVEAFADATRGEFERLKEFGINADTSGDQVTLRWMQNGQQMEERVTKNAEAIGEALAGIWNDMFAGGMDAQMSTFSGRWSNMMDAVTRAIQKFMGTGLFESLKGAIAAVTEALQGLEQSGKLEQWGSAAREAFSAAWSAVRRLSGMVADFVDRWGGLLTALGAVAGITLAVEKVGALTRALAASKLGIAGLLLVLPDAVAGWRNLALAANEYFNPQSTRNQAMRQSAQLQAQATENNRKAVAMLNRFAQAQGGSVTSLEDWNRKIADGTIKLSGHSGQVAATAADYKTLQEAVKKAGEAGNASLSQVADRYDTEAKQAKALAATEGAAAAAGLAAQRDKYKAVLSVAQAVAEAQKRLVNEAAAAEEQKAGLRRQIEQDLQKAKTAALKTWLEDLKNGLGEALAQEKRYAQEAENAHKTTEEKVRELRRQTMDQSSAYYDQLAEAREKLVKAGTEAAKGTAEGYDRAIKYAQEAQNTFASSVSTGKAVVGQVQAVQTAMKGVSDAGAVWESAAQGGKDAWADTARSLTDQIQEAKAALDELAKNPLSVAVEIDTAAVDAALDTLAGKRTASVHSVDPDTTDAEKAIAGLEKPTSSTHTIYVQKVEQYAWGGGVGRDVPAMAMPGEMVIDPEAAGKYGPLLHAINSLRLPLEAVPRFAAGGGVFRPFGSGLIPGVGDEDSEPLLLREGAFVVRKAAVARYGRNLLSAINAMRLPAGVAAFASGGPVRPDWWRLWPDAVPEASPVPAAPVPETVAAPVPAGAVLATPLATGGRGSVRRAAGVARLEGIRSRAALAFASGGSLDEQLADIALERQRTQEDYDEAIADAQNDRDSDLAELLAKEREDLDTIAADLAEALQEAQDAWQEARESYQQSLAEAQEAYTEAVEAARDEYDEKRKSLQAALDAAQEAYDEWVGKGKDEHPGYFKRSIHHSPGYTYMDDPGEFTRRSFSSVSTAYVKDLSDEGTAARKQYEAEGKKLKAALQEARSELLFLGAFAVPADAVESLDEAKTEAAESLALAKDTYSTGVSEAQTTADADSRTTREQAASDKADLDAALADKLADLKKDYDRAMEDLAIQEARARADADEEKGYSISGFSAWLAEGGPVRALAGPGRSAGGGFAGLLGRLARFAEGGTVPMLPGATPGADSVIAALTPGEGVINARAMARIISDKALAALNNLDLAGFVDELPHFATGGRVPGGEAPSVAGLAGGASPGSGYTVTLNLQAGGKTYEARTTDATAAALARQLRRLGQSVK